MISIIPLTYLLFLALMLTPLTWFLVLQIINFFKQQSYLSKESMPQSQSSDQQMYLNDEETYQIANIYINSKAWHIGLTILQNGIYRNSQMNKYWLAKYHNAIGFIFEQLDLDIISRQHYLLASTICPNYNYARKNLDRLNSK